MKEAPETREFVEDSTTRASVSATQLTIFAGGLAKPFIYPLEAIVQAGRMNLPGGQAVVAIFLIDRPTSPGLTFRDPSVANEFFTVLLDVIEKSV